MQIVFWRVADIFILVTFNCLHYIVKYNLIIQHKWSVFIYNNKVLAELNAIKN